MATNPTWLGEWTAPSGVRVVIGARVRVELTLRAPDEPGDLALARSEDRRWFVEEVLPQLRAPLQAMIDEQLVASGLVWDQPPEPA